MSDMVSILHHHGITAIDASTDTATDDAREAGVVWACTGCASIGAVTGSERERVLTRDAIDWDRFDCCPGATTLVF